MKYRSEEKLRLIGAESPNKSIFNNGWFKPSTKKPSKEDLESGVRSVIGNKYENLYFVNFNNGTTYVCEHDEAFELMGEQSYLYHDNKNKFIEPETHKEE